MENDFESKMQIITDSVNLDIRSQILNLIEYLRGNNAYSFDSMCTIVQEEQSNVDIRLIACWLFGQLSNKRAVKSLIAALNSPNAEIVSEAAKSLGIIKSKKAVQPLISILLKSDNPDKRISAAYALGILGDKRAYEPLIQTLINSREEPKVRGYSAEALAYLRDNKASSALIAMLTDASAVVRFWSAFALGELKEQQAVPALARLVADDQTVLPNWGVVSEEAAKAIDKIKSTT